MLFDLVFEGGGVRGIAYLGALQALEEKGHTIGRLMGTSVGGFVAALLATGHDINSINNLLFDAENGRLTFARVFTPYPEFTSREIHESATRQLLQNVDLDFLPNIFENKIDTLLAHSLMGHKAFHPFFSILEYTGMYDETKWLEWLSEQFNTYSNGEDWASLGLAKLYEKTGRSLTLIASDITDPDMLVLNHSTAPDLPLKWAVRMTAGAPFLFPPVEWRTDWGMYREHLLDGHKIVDGVLLSRFPLELFLSKGEQVKELMGPSEAGTNVIGFFLDARLPVMGYRPSKSHMFESLDIVPGLELLQMLIDALLANIKIASGDALEKHVLRLPTMGVNAYGFDLDRKSLQPVITTAFNVTKDFLDSWEHTPQPVLTNFEQNYVQVFAEKFINIGNVSNSGIAIGKGASADVELHES